MMNKLNFWKTTKMKKLICNPKFSRQAKIQLEQAMCETLGVYTFFSALEL